MNEELATYARNYLKENLVKLPEGYVNVFKRMYSPLNFDLPINDVVDNMPDEKLDWGMSQVKNSLNKINS